MTPPLPPGGWPLLIMLLLALGVPTAAGLAFAQQVTQEPWKALGLALLYEAIVFVGGSLAKVWQALESRWVAAIAEWIDTTVRSLRPGYRRRYLRHIIHQHRFFDVKGLTTQGPYSLKLEQVFVALRLDPQTTQRAGINPIPTVPATLQAGRHTLWDYLRAPQMRDQHLAVLGAPGSGKTTLLRHAALTMAARSWHTDRAIPRRLPILLFLRDHAGAIKENPSLALAQAIHDRLARLDGPSAPVGWFARQLGAGRCVVLLDGLDEVADPELRKQVVAWVERQMAAYATNRFVVTSRPFGYRSNPLAGVTVLEVQPLTQTDVARFIHNWYLANEIMSAQCQDAGVRATAKQGADDLLQRLRNAPNLAELAVNPLLLTMIANVHRYRSSLPGRRVELYAEICEVFLGKRRQATGLELDLTPAQKQSVLQALAYQMMCAEQREILLAEALVAIREPLTLVSPWMDGAAFLKDIENNSGLLLERENGIYSFAHLTFQEYLAAAAISKRGWAQDVAAYVGTSWWHETIRLYAAQADATPIVDACLADDRPSIEALTLAIECREEAMQLQPAARDKLEMLLTSGVDDRDPQRRRLVAETLLALRPRRMVRLDERRAIDTSLVTGAEYQLFLDERSAQGAYHQPDHWTDMRCAPGQGRTPVLGMRHSDAIAFCDWLSQRAGGTWRYRLPDRSEGMSEIDPLPSTAPFPTGVGCWVGPVQQPGYRHFSTFDAEQLSGRVEDQWVRDNLSNRVLIFLLDQDLARDLARALARDLERDQEPDLAYVLALARALALAHDLDFDLTRDLNHARYLDLARDLSHAVAHALLFDLIGDLDLAHARDRARDLDLALARANHALARAHTRVLASNLALALARALALALASDFIDDRDYSPARTKAAFQALVRSLASEQVERRMPALLRASISRHDQIQNLDLVQAIGQALDPDRDLDALGATGQASIAPAHLAHAIRKVAPSLLPFDRALALSLQRTAAGGTAAPTEREAARRSVRVWALMAATCLTDRLDSRRWIDRVKPGGGSAEEELKRRLDAYLDLYVGFALLEQRIAGALPPCEGILLVRERIDEETDAAPGSPTHSGDGTRRRLRA